MNDKTAEIITRHLEWLEGVRGGEKADLHEAYLQRADLHGADLQRVDLHEANLHGADLHEAYLHEAYLHGADLHGANLRWANLRGADLRGADLRGADLRWANLRGADLRGADLDYSCWPLWCGSKGVKVDRKLAAQLAAHFCVLDCDDPDYIAARDAILAFAKTSRRAQDLRLK